MTESGDAFAAGVRTKVEDPSARWIVGGRPGPMVQTDQSVRFKDMLANAAVFDRELLARTPSNPTWRWDFSRGWLSRLVGLRTRVVAVLAVDLHEVVRRAGREAADPDPWPPLSSDALDMALRDYRDPPARTFVGVCSPSGFSDEAIALARRRGSSLQARGGRLVLVSPRADGGWLARLPQDGSEGERAAGSSERTWLFIFDPEPVDDKIERVRAAIRSAGLELSAGGLHDRELAERLEVPLALVDEVFEYESSRRQGLRVRQFDGEQVLLGQAGPAGDDTERTTSMFRKLRDLLGLGGSAEKKIELLADKRALLTSRRDRLYREMDELGEREAQLKQRGVAADSTVTRRRLASELAQVRQRIGQGNTMVGLLNRQIDILSTHIHHLTLLGQGRTVDMPDVEEMTRDAVAAEELLERVKGEAEMVESLADATGASLGSKAEAVILAEFEQAAREQKAAPEPDRAVQGERAESPPQTELDRGVGPEKRRDQPLRE